MRGGNDSKNLAPHWSTVPSHRLLLRYLTLTAIVLFGTTSAYAQKTASKPQPAGTISGQVTMHGKPIAGIPVAAIAGDTINRRDSAARAVTDGEGYYRLIGLSPGEYQIWALTPGLIAEQQPFPGYSPYGSIKSILLSPNEDATNIDLKLISGCVIAGRITTVENRPVVEEQVALELLDENGNPRFRVPRSFSDLSRTDDRGIYRIYGLPAGRYKVSVGYDPSEGVRTGSLYQRTYYSELSDPSKAAVVELKEGAEANDIDIKVDHPTSTFVVSGRIVDATTGRSVSGVRFRIAVAQKDREGPSAFVGFPTDSKGEFRFEGLRPGRYSIVATSEFDGGTNFYGDPIYFEVIDHDVTGLEIKAVPGLILSGAVIAEGLTTRELLALLPDLRVYARSETSPPTQGSGGGSAAIAPDGSFLVSGLRPGRVSIDLFTMRYSATRPTIARVEREGLDIGRSFEIQQSTSAVVLTVNYGTGTIRGTVRFAGGEDPGDSRIFISFRREGSHDGTSVPADARGNFIIRNLAPGTYEVEVQLTPSRGSLRPRAPQKQLVNVTNGSESEVSFLVDLSKGQ